MPLAGVIASNGVQGVAPEGSSEGSGIMGDFRLSYFETGVLPAAFMGGRYLLATDAPTVLIARLQ